ncbi:SseB family protein [Microbacterium esteraromaticum]|uniref:SseB family protein n=1 Tax=Microbacterium TaxID=33882 RepID=UPI0019D3E3F3|nr:SseB family protein [Microbacterium esteraromaticum]MBN7794923.1 SseB family protein [Microbacterium esteraromaticum]MBN8425800.1 SseB family protein [Microbacterium esteraromaticum]MBY6062549.1 SseB family protein [Microbacterium esteraromaticum]MCA1307550.1 SseB family protein [Microbacterium esteraromaticum]WDH77848.1 SseB family protein [Microbacterium esteraromaticum]
MSQGTDDACDHGAPADSAGVPWEGRSFETNPHAADDGSADPALLAALRRFRSGEGSQVEVVDALRSARVLVPLVAERGDEGVGPTGLKVDKTQELSIVTVAAPDGRRVQPVFSSVDTMRRWDAQARPIPVEAVRVALSASSEQTDLIVLDPASDTEFVVRRPAIWAMAQSQPWEPSFLSPEVFTALRESIAHELAVIDVAVASGDADARMRGPELIVTLTLIDGLDRETLDAVLARLAQRWAADDRMAVLVDSLTVKLTRSEVS